LLEEISWPTLTVAQKMRDRLSLIEAVDFQFLSSVILSRSRDGAAVSHQAERREAEQTSLRGAFRKDLAAHPFAP